MGSKLYINSYWKAERHESLFLIGWGILSVVVGIVLLLRYSNEPFTQGFSYVIMPMGAIFCLSGVIALVRHTLRAMKNMDQSDLVAQEQSRAKRLLHYLGNWRTLDQLLFLVGFGMMLLGGLFDFGVFMAGSGIGLTIQSVVLFIKDLWALWRTSLYLVELKED